MGATAALSLLLLAAPAVILPTAALYILLYCLQSIQQSLVTSLSIEHINAGTPLNFSLARGFGSFAFAVLSLALGFLVDDYGSWVIMVANVVIGVAGIALALTFRRAARGDAASGARPSASLIEFAAKHRRFMAVAVSIALLFFSHILINTYTIQIITNVGGSGADMGAATALAGFLELPAMALFPLLLRRLRSAGTIMKISAVFIVLKTLVTLLAPDVFWIYVAQCLQFFAFAMFVPSSVFYVNDAIGDADKVKGQASLGMAMAISAMVSNVSGGLMLDMRGVSFMLDGRAGGVAGCLALLLLIDGVRPRPVAPPRPIETGA